MVLSSLSSYPPTNDVFDCIQCSIPVTGTSAEVIIRCLEEEGVEYVFCIPGEETLDLIEAIRQS